jgi:hypothetical protein
MDVRVEFRDALAILRRSLRAQGFAGKGAAFHRAAASGNVETISIQKSTKSSGAELLIAINYGVYSARIGGCLGEDVSLSRDVFSAHFRKRVSENGRELWLHVTAKDSAGSIAELLLGAIKTALADLVEHSTDEALRDTWLSGTSPGIVNTRKLLFLSILLNTIGPADRLPDVVKELRKSVENSIHSALVEQQLARAGILVEK